MTATCSCAHPIVIACLAPAGVDAASCIIAQTCLGLVFCSRAETGKLLSFKRDQPELMASLVHIVQVCVSVCVWGEAAE